MWKLIQDPEGKLYLVVALQDGCDEDEEFSEWDILGFGDSEKDALLMALGSALSCQKRLYEELTRFVEKVFEGDMYLRDSFSLERILVPIPHIFEPGNQDSAADGFRQMCFYKEDQSWLRDYEMMTFSRE